MKTVCIDLGACINKCIGSELKQKSTTDVWGFVVSLIAVRVENRVGGEKARRMWALKCTAFGSLCRSGLGFIYKTWGAGVGGWGSNILLLLQMFLFTFCNLLFFTCARLVLQFWRWIHQTWDEELIYEVQHQYETCVLMWSATTGVDEVFVKVIIMLHHLHVSFIHHCWVVIKDVALPIASSQAKSSVCIHSNKW